MGAIVMRNTAKYGRGIFADRYMNKGELIEEAPVIIIPKQEWRQMRKSVLLNYVFRWGKDKAIALGYGSSIITPLLLTQSTLPIFKTKL